MPKTVTLRLKDDVYALFQAMAEQDNRPLSNLIETAALRFIENETFVDEFEMEEIQNNKPLNDSLKRARRDAKAGRGRFV